MGKEKQDLELYLRYSFHTLPVGEYRFHPVRRWRLDYAFPDLKVAVEYEGMAFHGGKSRHTTVTGYTGDCEKYNELAILGWVVIRVNAPLIKSGVAFNQIARAITARGGEIDQTLYPHNGDEDGRRRGGSTVQPVRGASVRRA